MTVWTLSHDNGVYCECEYRCNCSGLRLDSIYLTKEAAQEAKSKTYNPKNYEIEEYEVMGNVEPIEYKPGINDLVH